MVLLIIPIIIMARLQELDEFLILLTCKIGEKIIMNSIFYSREYIPKAGDFVVTLEGKKIQQKEQFLKKMENAFHFPRACEGLMARYNDWMTDLDWINEKSIALIIKDFKCFLSDDPYFKKKVMKNFEENILPFWEDRVTKVVVDGETREFNIYCF